MGKEGWVLVHFISQLSDALNYFALNRIRWECITQAIPDSPDKVWVPTYFIRTLIKFMKLLIAKCLLRTPLSSKSVDSLVNLLSLLDHLLALVPINLYFEYPFVKSLFPSLRVLSA